MYIKLPGLLSEKVSGNVLIAPRQKVMGQWEGRNI